MAHVKEVDSRTVHAQKGVTLQFGSCTPGFAEIYLHSAVARQKHPEIDFHAQYRFDCQILLHTLLGLARSIVLAMSIVSRCALSNR